MEYAGGEGREVSLVEDFAHVQWKTGEGLRPDIEERKIVLNRNVREIPIEVMVTGEVPYIWRKPCEKMVVSKKHTKQIRTFFVLDFSQNRSETRRLSVEENIAQG